MTTEAQTPPATDSVPVTVQLQAVWDRASGNVYMAAGPGLMPMGNIDGRIYLTRVLQAVDGMFNIPPDLPVGWTLNLPDGTTAKPEMIVSQALVLNMLVTHDVPPAETTIGAFLEAVGDAHLPRYMDGQMSLLQASVEAADVAIRSRRNMASPQEVRIALESVLAFTTAMPEDVVNCKMVREDAPPAIILPNSAKKSRKKPVQH